MRVVGQVGQRYLRLSPLDPDRPDEQARLGLLTLGDMLNVGMHLVFGRLLWPSFALLRRSHHSGVHDLSTHGQMVALLQLSVKGKEQRHQRASLAQLLAEQLDRVGVRRRRPQIKAQEPQPARSSPDQIPHPPF